MHSAYRNELALDEKVLILVKFIYTLAKETRDTVLLAGWSPTLSVNSKGLSYTDFSPKIHSIKVKYIMSKVEYIVQCPFEYTILIFWN